VRGVQKGKFVKETESKVPTLSVVTHFYNSSWILDRVSEWKALPDWVRKDTEFIVVDDCSREPLEIDFKGLNARYFRITTDIAWNQAGARNLGVVQSKGDWLLMHDVDQYFYPIFFEEALQRIYKTRLAQDTMYFVRIKELVNIQNGQSLSHHPNSFLVSRQTFVDYAMYDEDFVGCYGYEDVYLVRAWVASGLKRDLIEPIYCEDVGVSTKNLNRDLRRNLELCHSKLSKKTDFSHSRGLLRFNWKRLF
jgi:glycosyltransferase involved in cell wall biosynthesis